MRSDARPDRLGLRPIRHARAWLALWLLALAVVILASLLPPPSGLPTLRGGDKLLHLGSYAALMAAAVQLFQRPARLWLIACLLVGLGLGLEYAQGLLTTSRRFEWTDALANSGGVTLGALLIGRRAAGWLQRAFPLRSG